MVSEVEVGCGKRCRVRKVPLTWAASFIGDAQADLSNGQGHLVHDLQMGAAQACHALEVAKRIQAKKGNG